MYVETATSLRTCVSSLHRESTDNELAARLDRFNAVSGTRRCCRDGLQGGCGTCAEISTGKGETVGEWEPFVASEDDPRLRYRSLKASDQSGFSIRQEQTM